VKKKKKKSSRGHKNAIVYIYIYIYRPKDSYEAVEFSREIVQNAWRSCAYLIETLEGTRQKEKQKPRLKRIREKSRLITCTLSFFRSEDNGDPFRVFVSVQGV